MDRGYLDFGRLHRFELAGAFFVARAKAGVRLNRLQSRPMDKGTGVRSGQVVWLSLLKSIEHYPDRLRRIGYEASESAKVLVFLTNMTCAHLRLRCCTNGPRAPGVGEHSANQSKSMRISTESAPVQRIC
jgi:hypothetical protein